MTTKTPTRKRRYALAAHRWQSGRDVVRVENRGYDKSIIIRAGHCRVFSAPITRSKREKKEDGKKENGLIAVCSAASHSVSRWMPGGRASRSLRISTSGVG